MVSLNRSLASKMNFATVLLVKMQPVDSAALTELRKRLPAANGLLCAGSIVSLTWTATKFTGPVAVRYDFTPLLCH